jgi:hypothetical protein
MMFLISLHASIANISMTTAKTFGSYSYSQCLILDTAWQSYIDVVLVLVSLLI